MKDLNITNLRVGALVSVNCRVTDVGLTEVTVEFGGLRATATSEAITGVVKQPLRFNDRIRWYVDEQYLTGRFRDHLRTDSDKCVVTKFDGSEHVVETASVIHENTKDPQA